MSAADTVLPPALWELIVKDLGMPDLLSAACTCTCLRRIVGELPIFLQDAAAAQQRLDFAQQWRDSLLLAAAWRHQRHADSAQSWQQLLQDAELPGAAGTSLAASLAALSLGPQQQQQQLFEFSSFWLPSTALLTTSCLITDGQCATVFLEQQPLREPQRAPVQSGSFLLLKGHLAPADTSANTPLSQLLHDPGGSAAANGTPGAAPLAPQQHGLMHLLACVQRSWSPGVYRPAQAILMPQQQPPGSISGLRHPWPPSAGCCGARRRLLREVLLRSLPALLLPASAGGGHIDGLGRFLVGAPASWLATLGALDVSGQSDVSDKQLSRVLGSCHALVIACLADSHAASLTLMILGSPEPPPPFGPPPCGRYLRVLDVSGCAALAGAAGSQQPLRHCAFKCFRAALGRLQSLEELRAARIDADRAFAFDGAAPAAALLPMAAAIARSLAASPAAAAAEDAYCRTLGRLVALDLSDSTLSAGVLAQLLRRCHSLKRLNAAGCRSLAEGELELHAALLQQQQEHQLQEQRQQPCLPALTHLAVGWGWSAAAISSVLASSPCLTSFTAAVGAGVSDGVLQHLATACRDLQHLGLSLCAVSSAGVAAVLAGCPKLHALQLQQCVGPLHLADIMGLAPAAEHCSSSSNSRWRLSTLQLSGPPCVASDSGLLCLLSGGSARALPHLLPLPRLPLAHLCLGRVQGLSDALLEALAACGPPLRDLRLEDCSAPGGAGPAFSPRAVLQLASACPTTLHSLQLRHATAAPLPADFVGAVVRVAPLLKMLCLDACDLAAHGGFELGSSGRHAALTTVHVCRCKEVQGLAAARVDKELVVHLLQHGRSVHLAAD